MYKYYFSHGRAALLNGIKKYNFSSHDTVLIPDYLCEIVEVTLKSLNLKIIKYKIKDDFTINMQSLKSKLLLNDIKALMLVNYFGFPQKINFIKRFCKKNKILIIEDNSHGYGGKVENKLLGTRGDFGFSSPRKVLKIYSGGVLYCNKRIKFKLNKYKHSIKSIIIRLINKNLFLKLFIKKNLLFKKDFSNPYIQRDNVIYNMAIDDFSLSEINKSNIKKEKSKRFINYMIWKKFLKENDIKPIFKKIDKNLMIWCLPFYVKNSKEAKKWFSWGYKNGITIFSWPDLNIDNVKKNTKCFKRWKRLVCLPLDVPSNFLKEICN
jgi:hypothetical protein